MMKVLRTILAAAMLILPLSLGAQTKAETSLYNKTMAKPSVKAADKFLKKFPQSVYAQEVLDMKEGILNDAFAKDNVSTLSKTDALGAAGGALDAVGWKKDRKEHVLSLGKDLELCILSPDGALEGTRQIPVYTMEETPGELRLVIPMEVISPVGARRNYVHFAYRNGETEYVEVLYLPEEDILHQAMFYGTPVKDGGIEGQSPEMIEGLTLTPEVLWLVSRLRENPSLVQISKADILTDESIRWWLSKNPKAQTSASKVSFGLLDPESSMVAAFKKASKERGKSYSTALFDIRGYTVICASKGGEYSLLWAEPVCRNRKTDKYIRSIYFESDGTTLDLMYYKGSKTFKKKISLASQSLRHFN
jgi:hypothetical protein